MVEQGLAAVYLITGTDLPKVALALRRLRGRFDGGSIDHLLADSTSGADAVAALNAMGLFDGEKLVLVEGIDRWKSADVDTVVAYLASPTPGSTLALVGDPAKLAGLEKAIEGAGSVLRYDVPTRRRGRQEVPDYPRWVQAQFERGGLRVDHATAERLVELVGEDAFALLNEVEKLTVWSGGAPVGIREVEDLVVPGAETSAFALVDAWGNRDVADALGACEALRRKGEEPYRVAVRLADHVAKVRRVHALVEQDVGPREIAVRLGLKEYPARKQAGQATNFTRAELETAVVRMSQLDLAIKGGSRLDPDLELERAIVEISRHRPA
jgi:DNA polymerase-3 subunit delta